jgi:Domain of unknown function (DUF1877)
MSMICWLLGLSSAQIVQLRANPSLVADLAMQMHEQQAHADLAAALQRMPADRREAAEARFRAIQRAPGAREADARKTDARAQLDRIGPFERPLELGKSWHMLHYLFTGHVHDSSAPGDLLLTGEDLGDDVGYGPARLHGAKEVTDFASFLNAQDTVRLQARVNYREMSDVGIYSMPMGPGTEDQYEAELRAEVAAYFPLLRDYVVEMAAKQAGLLIWLS